MFRGARGGICETRSSKRDGYSNYSPTLDNFVSAPLKLKVEAGIAFGQNLLFIIQGKQLNVTIIKGAIEKNFKPLSFGFCAYVTIIIASLHAWW